MNTTIYFIRHAESDLSVKDPLTRPLTPKGVKDSNLVVNSFRGISIDLFYSSPFLRSIETIRPLAEQAGKEITVIDDFRERSIGCWLEDFFSYAELQWNNFDYKLEGGESLRETQTRNITALEEIIRKMDDLSCGVAPNCAVERGAVRTIAIGTHGTALSTILNNYDPGYGYQEFLKIVDRMPLIVQVIFKDGKYQSYRI